MVKIIRNLNQSYYNSLAIYLILTLFLSLSSPISITAMTAATKEQITPHASYFSSVVSWLNSSAYELYRMYIEREFGFTVLIPHCDSLTQRLRTVLRGETNVNYDLELLEAVLFYGTPATVRFFIEHGAQWKPAFICELSSPRYGPETKKIEKLKLLLKTGNIDVNGVSGKETMLSTVFGTLSSDRKDQCFDYHCEYAKILLGAGADPNFLHQNKLMPFERFIGDIMRLKLFPEDKKKLMFNVFLACGAALSPDIKNCLERERPHIATFIESFETDKAALFSAIQARDYVAIKQLSQRLPFKVKNAERNYPLHHAVLTLPGAVFNNGQLNEEAQKSKPIVILLLRILRLLAALKNGEGKNPIELTRGANRFWMLNHCFIPATGRPVLGTTSISK